MTTVQEFIDEVLQWLTTAPFGVQVFIVVPVVFLLCGVLALLWLRAVDIAGALAMRAWDRIVTSMTRPAAKEEH